VKAYTPSVANEASGETMPGWMIAIIVIVPVMVFVWLKLQKKN
jgi:hypothetical protein